jgi:crotonobetainyl-CoA:carnitine CoA-transferase CaiB-like acyl-CoA transferase
MQAMDKAEIASDPRYASNAGRVEHQDFIDGLIAVWTQGRSSGEVIAVLEAAEVPVGPIYSVADMVSDPHYQARGLFERVEVKGASLDIPAILPKLSQTPGGTEWPGGEVGTHTDVVLKDVGYSAKELAELRQRGAI